jgi:septal ring factor EnvC (AmiA/AmiB activator)
MKVTIDELSQQNQKMTAQLSQLMGELQQTRLAYQTTVNSLNHVNKTNHLLESTLSKLKNELPASTHHHHHYHPPN